MRWPQLACVCGALDVWDDKALTVALGIWAVVLLAAVFPSLFTSADPNGKDFLSVLKPPFHAKHILGSDELGEDVYSRIVYGARTSVEVGAGAVAIGALIGIAAGIISGYTRRAKEVVGFLVDVKMAFPA